MDFFARLIHTWLWFVYFSFTSKETRQNQNNALILMLIRAVARFWYVSLDVREKYTNQCHESSEQRNLYCYSWHEANICGLQVRN